MVEKFIERERERERTMVRLFGQVGIGQHPGQMGLWWLSKVFKFYKKLSLEFQFPKIKSGLRFNFLCAISRGDKIGHDL